MMAWLCRMRPLASGTSRSFAAHNPGDAPFHAATRSGENAWKKAWKNAQTRGIAPVLTSCLSALAFCHAAVPGKKDIKRITASA
jgi:hypothetical protein